MRAALEIFERILEIDPTSIDAKIGIAMVLAGNLVEGWGQQTEARAEQLLLEVLGRQPNSSTAHYVMGLLRRAQSRLTEARIEFETAISFDQNDWRAYRQLGITLMFLGQPEQAIPKIEKSIKLNPRDPNIHAGYGLLGVCYLLLADADKAIELLSRARAANSQLYWIHLDLAAALGLKGHLDEAKAALAEGIKLKPEVNSLAAWHARYPSTNPRYLALRAKNWDAGLRRAGMPDE